MTTVRQPCSIPQSGWMSGESKCLARHTGWSSIGAGAGSGSGKMSAMSCLNPRSNSPAATAVLREQGTPLLDELAEVSLAISGTGVRDGH